MLVGEEGRKVAGRLGILPIMIIGVGLDSRLALPFDQLRSAAIEAARLGFESVWTPAGGVPDSFHVCAAWAQDTGLRTGISVVPATRMWTPLGLAAQAATLAQLSSGKFVLGLGTGGYGPGWFAFVGLPDRPIAVMREYVTQVRGLLAGDMITVGQQAVIRPAPGWPASAALGVSGLPAAPVYLAALGPQMLRLAGEVADGALLNWATPERIAISRKWVDEGAARACRAPGSIPMTMYIRVCIDDDVAAARQALGAQVLSYAMGRPDVPDNSGYRGLFGQMGFDAELTELEARQERGEALTDLVADIPDEMLRAVGYYGPAAEAPAAFARLSAGLDETIVRIVTARPGLEPVSEAMAALTPALIRAAALSGRPEVLTAGRVWLRSVTVGPIGRCPRARHTRGQVAELGIARLVGRQVVWLVRRQMPDHVEGDELREPLIARDTDVASPAGDRQRQPCAAEVDCAGTGSAPEVYSLAEGLAGGKQHDGDLAAARVDPRLRAAGADPVRRNDAPCSRDEVAPGRSPEKGGAGEHGQAGDYAQRDGYPGQHDQRHGHADPQDQFVSPSPHHDQWVRRGNGAERILQTRQGLPGAARAW